MIKNNLKTKKLTLILFVIIILIAYYMLFYKPINKKIESYKSKTLTLSQSISEEKKKKSKYDSMQREIESYKKIGSKIYDYDAAGKELSYLSSVMSGALDYDFSFEVPTTEDEVYVRRNVKVSFTTKNYADARNIIDRIICSPQRTILRNVTLTPINFSNDASAANRCLSGNCNVSTTCDVVFIELCKGKENAWGLTYVK